MFLPRWVTSWVPNFFFVSLRTCRLNAVSLSVHANAILGRLLWQRTSALSSQLRKWLRRKEYERWFWLFCLFGSSFNVMQCTIRIVVTMLNHESYNFLETMSCFACFSVCVKWFCRITLIRLGCSWLWLSIFMWFEFYKQVANVTNEKWFEEWACIFLSQNDSLNTICNYLEYDARILF